MTTSILDELSDLKEELLRIKTMIITEEKLTQILREELITIPLKWNTLQELKIV